MLVQNNINPGLLGLISSFIIIQEKHSPSCSEKGQNHALAHFALISTRIIHSLLAAATEIRAILPFSLRLRECFYRFFENSKLSLLVFFCVFYILLIMIDLHVHSTASDGQYTPTELVQMAKEKGFSAIAITDHDTVSGLEEGKRTAEDLGIIFVPGIEIDIDRPNCEFHLLGLGLQEISSELNTLIASLQEKRLERNMQIVQKMNDAGINATVEEIQAEFPNQVLGRPHFASWLEKNKIVKHKQDAFDKYLGRGRPWFVEKDGAQLDEAIFAIKKSGGLPVIAHPFSLYLSWKNLDAELENLKQRGVSGVEAYHSGSKPSQCSRLEELAKKHGFFVTAGSDFHGEKVHPDRSLGRTCAKRKIDDRFYFEELLPALKQV